MKNLKDISKKISLVTATDYPRLQFHSAHIYNELWLSYLDDDDRILCTPLLRHKTFKKYQFYAINHKGKLIACIRTVPIFWNGKKTGLPSGFTAMLNQAYFQDKESIPSNTLALVSITINSQFQGHGYSYIILKKIKAFAKSLKYKNIIAPVRPSLKMKYPTMSLKKYLLLKDKNWEFYDPWLRVHVKLGGKILKISYNSIIIKKSLSYWKKVLKIKATARKHIKCLRGLHYLKLIFLKNWYIQRTEYLVHPQTLRKISY